MDINSTVIYVYAETPERAGEALAFSKKINAEYSDRIHSSVNELTVCFGADSVYISGNNMSLKGDFSGLTRRIKKNNLQSELIVKASKLSDTENPVLFDATAGLGEDSFLTAAAGFRVYMFEHNPVISLLLADSLKRASDNPEIAGISGRITVTEGDSVLNMKNSRESPDVIYLDPMFPQKTKNSQTNKKLQLLHMIEMPCQNEEQLIQAAISKKPKKIIIKRPVKGNPLAGIKPNYSLKGKTVRFDIIAL